MEPVHPSYDAGGLVGVVPALLGVHPRGHLPAPVQGAASVVLLVLDGLGWNVLAERPADVPTLAAMEGGPITTVVPSTTASALTSLTTGLAPSRHGVVGFRVRVDGTVLNILSWHAAGGPAPDPFVVQRNPVFFGRDVPVVTKAEFAKTGFTDVHHRGARFVGWHTVSGLVEHCRRLVTGGEPFVYAYYPGVDTVAHAYGLLDRFYDAELAFVDELVARVLAALPPSAVLVVTSDHGQVQVGPEGWVGLEPVAEMVNAYSGDGRFRYLHARKGAAVALVDVAADALGDRAWVLSREQLLDEGWLGPPPAPPVRRRLGDVVLAAKGAVAFVDPGLVREAQLISAHGSLTAAEMLVPLVAARGTGA